MSEDYYKTLIKDIIENNEKEKAIEIIANKLNEKQISNEKEMLTNLDKDKEIERLNNIINELEKYTDEDDWTSVNGEIAIRLIKLKLQELKGSDKE